MHDISFALVRNVDGVTSHVLEHVAPLLSDAKIKSEEALLAAVQTIPQADCFLLIDGDRTLCPQDTEKMFFETVPGTTGDPLKQIFERYPTYTFQAFLEVAMLHERVVSESEYQRLCNEIGSSQVEIYPGWVTFLSKLPANILPMLVTLGICEIWTAAHAKYGLFATENTPMTIVARNHIGLHPYIVDSHAKALVATQLRKMYGGCKILSFGASGTWKV